MVVLEDLEVVDLEDLLASGVLVVDSLFQRILLIDDIFVDVVVRLDSLIVNSKLIVD